MLFGFSCVFDVFIFGRQAPYWTLTSVSSDDAARHSFSAAPLSHTLYKFLQLAAEAQRREAERKTRGAAGWTGTGVGGRSKKRMGGGGGGDMGDDEDDEGGGGRGTKGVLIREGFYNVDASSNQSASAVSAAAQRHHHVRRASEHEGYFESSSSSHASSSLSSSPSSSSSSNSSTAADLPSGAHLYLADMEDAIVEKVSKSELFAGFELL